MVVPCQPGQVVTEAALRFGGQVCEEAAFRPFLLRGVGIENLVAYSVRCPSVETKTFRSTGK